MVAAISRVTRRPAVRVAAGLGLLLSLATCRTGRNYTNADSPRYAGGSPAAVAKGDRGTML